jgi:hypothetical protein
MKQRGTAHRGSQRHGRLPRIKTGSWSIGFPPPFDEKRSGACEGTKRLPIEVEFVGLIDELHETAFAERSSDFRGRKALPAVFFGEARAFVHDDLGLTDGDEHRSREPSKNLWVELQCC